MVKYHPEGPEGSTELTIDFTPPWPRIPMVEGLEVRAWRIGRGVSSFTLNSEE